LEGNGCPESEIVLCSEQRPEVEHRFMLRPKSWPRQGPAMTMFNKSNRKSQALSGAKKIPVFRGT
jgi:hypothetical protein